MPAKTTTDLPVRYFDAAAIPAINDFAPGQKLAIYNNGCRKPWTGKVVETSTHSEIVYLVGARGGRRSLVRNVMSGRVYLCNGTDSTVVAAIE